MNNDIHMFSSFFSLKFYSTLYYSKNRDWHFEIGTLPSFLSWKQNVDQTLSYLGLMRISISIKTIRTINTDKERECAEGWTRNGISYCRKHFRSWGTKIKDHCFHTAEDPWENDSRSRRRWLFFAFAGNWHCVSANVPMKLFSILPLPPPLTLWNVTAIDNSRLIERFDYSLKYIYS